MYDILLNLLFNSTSVQLSDKQILIVTGGATLLVILAFSFISISMAKLFKYICKF